MEYSAIATLLETLKDTNPLKDDIAIDDRKMLVSALQLGTRRATSPTCTIFPAGENPHRPFAFPQGKACDKVGTRDRRNVYVLPLHSMTVSGS